MIQLKTFNVLSQTHVKCQPHLIPSLNRERRAGVTLRWGCVRSWFCRVIYCFILTFSTYLLLVSASLPPTHVPPVCLTQIPIVSTCGSCCASPLSCVRVSSFFFFFLIDFDLLIILHSYLLPPFLLWIIYSGNLDCLGVWQLVYLITETRGQSFDR